MKALRVLQFIWLLPMTILVWALYVLPAWALGWIVYDGSPDFLVWAFVVQKEDSWYTLCWEDWAGWSGPCVVITKEDPDDDLRYVRTMAHELRHCQQQLLFGVLHYPLYALASVAIWIGFRDLHAYYDNPFERDARRAAGQPVHIPRDQWRKGPGDRWPWWVVVALLGSLVSTPARAACDPLFPDRCAAPMKAGQPAPFAGQLYSPQLATALAQKAQNADRRVKLAVAKTSSVASVRLRGALYKAEVDRGVAKTVGRLEGHREGYAEGLAAGTPSWYEHPVFVALLAVGCTIATAVAIKQARIVE